MDISITIKEKELKIMRRVKVIFVAMMTALLLTIGLSSCNGDPADATLFVGKYEGTASYAKTKDGLALVLAEKVDIIVTKIGDSYTFKFSSDKIPTLRGVKMEKGENATLKIESAEFGAITIDENNLTIVAYTTSEGSWSANAKRVK